MKMILRHVVLIVSRVSHCLPGPKSISAGSAAIGVAPIRNILSKAAGKPSILFAEVPPIGIDAINTIQIKMPDKIPKKQAKLFLPSFGFLRPPKYNAVTERMSPKLMIKMTVMRANNVNI